MPVSECIHSSDMSGVCITEVSFPQLCSRRTTREHPKGNRPHSQRRLRQPPGPPLLSKISERRPNRWTRSATGCTPGPGERELGGAPGQVLQGRRQGKPHPSAAQFSGQRSKGSKPDKAARRQPPQPGQGISRFLLRPASGSGQVVAARLEQGQVRQGQQGGPGPQNPGQRPESACTPTIGCSQLSPAGCGFHAIPENLDDPPLGERARGSSGLDHPNLYKVSTKWHTDKEKAPDTLVTTLRTTLFYCTISTLLDRVTDMSQKP